MSLVVVPVVMLPAVRGAHTGWEYHMRPAIAEALDRWGSGEHPFVGDFLRAVLENDLAGAVSRADPENLAALKDIVTYVHTELPALSHGSPADCTAWQRRWRQRAESPAEAAHPEEPEGAP